MAGEILTLDHTHCVRDFEKVATEAMRLHEDSVRSRLADVARQEEKRRHLLRVLERPTPPWNPSDHPELEAEGGAAAWVKKLRHEAEAASRRHTKAKNQE